MSAEAINASQSIAVTRRAPARPWVGIARPAESQQATPAATSYRIAIEPEDSKSLRDADLDGQRGGAFVVSK
jgi:hypothetical protein